MPNLLRFSYEAKCLSSRIDWQDDKARVVTNSFEVKMEAAAMQRKIIKELFPMSPFSVSKFLLNCSFVLL